MTERELNHYYNTGGFNRPDRIGYMMTMIRNLRPLTETEWRIWYLENVHGEDYLLGLAKEMVKTIPASYHASVEECRAYIYDVMFRRTFLGYNKEKQALWILRKNISLNVQESPPDWDTLYFIDFYVRGSHNQLVGIQLKPETFFRGNYQNVVDIEGKMEAFCREYNAWAYILIYKQTAGEGIEFSNPAIFQEIRRKLL